MIFDKRINLKPYEYPELLQFKDAIQHSYWLISEYNFTQDVQDYHVNINQAERNAIKNTMLAISQVEVSVKAFWGRLYDKMPKPELAMVGYSFAESEIRHSESYSHLLEILGLNRAFEDIDKIPALADRVNYLERYLEGAKSRDNKAYTMSLLLFSVFTENVSLFSQFLIMSAFNKYTNKFKGINNVILATSKEENLHGLFGMQLINIIKTENPDWFDDEWEQRVIRACRKAYAAENKVLDWIFEHGELDFLPKRTIQAFIQDRYNQSLNSVGISPIFNVDPSDIEQTTWFDEELKGNSQVDFFNKRPISYSKFQQSVSEDDLF